MPRSSPLAGPAAEQGVVEKIVRSPGRFCVATLLITVAGLGLDRYADLGAQIALGLVTAGFLVVALIHITPMERAQTAVVVIVATMGEIVASIVLGIYEYRLGNLPLFVPPGHGLVYLTGLRLSQTPWARRYRRTFVRMAIGGVLAWAGLGLIALERTDVAGAVGAVVLTVFLLRGRAPEVYAGVFVAVAFLEVYGTALGTWTWAEHIPALGIPNGNPPSGAASGYVLFDIAALALGPALLVASVRARAGTARLACHVARRARQLPALAKPRLSDQS